MSHFKNSAANYVIFIVDDAPWHNILLAKILRSCGYIVQSFTDGYALLACLQTQKPHLIISDIDMPGMNGLELSRIICDLPGCTHIPILHVSSIKKEEGVRKSHAHGAVGFMQKPLKKEAFLEIVAQKL